MYFVKVLKTRHGLRFRVEVINFSLWFFSPSKVKNGNSRLDTALL